jgi:hypothetical protein
LPGVGILILLKFCFSLTTVQRLRKPVAILLLTLLLLNILGFYGLFFGLKLQNDHSMTQKLDEDNYDASETITVKIPIAVPYAMDSEGFSRVDGSFQYKGEFYRLVKQALLQDTLHVVCIKDHQGKRIDQALDTFVQTFSDKPSSEHQNIITFADFIKDYLTTSVSITQLSFGWELEVSKAASVASFISTYYPSFVHPPERA